MRKVIVLSGVSGSGKSEYARLLARESTNGKAVIASADDYFMKNGVYQFDPSCLSKAHGACFKKVIEALDYHDGPVSIIVVDNTNTTVAEIAPYMLAAAAFGCEAEIVTLDHDDASYRDQYLCACASRNKHGVSVTTIDQQYQRIRERRLLPWWKHRLHLEQERAT